MTDSLGYRLKVGVLVPSTHTSAQPEMDDLRPAGVTNHIGRMIIQDDSMVEQPGFNKVMHMIRNSTVPAIGSVVSCKPDCLIIGVSPESYWEGPDSHAGFVKSLQDEAGGLPITTSPDAIREALLALGDLKKIAVITPYLPVGDDSVSRFFTDSGYDVVRILGLGSHSPAKISHVSREQLREAIREVDSPDVEAIVQVGTNVALAGFAPVAEQRIGKPVISNNAVLYWHALRSNGINDRVAGFGSLLSEH